MRLALRLLLEAHERAQQEGLTHTEAALCTNDLVAGGVAVGTLQLLLNLGQVECVAGTEAEGLDRSAAPQLGPVTRLMLTEQGRVASGRLLGVAGLDSKPSWRAGSRELWWQGRRIKKFRNDAANQRFVLDEFQAAGWPPRLEITFPRRKGVNFKNRLRETARGLKKGQNPLCIRFSLDGTAGGIRWEAVT